MSNLSDFSYLHSGMSFGFLLLWSFYRVWSFDRFRCLHPRRFQRGELKSVVTLLVLLMMPFQIYYDVTTVRIKYDEGFIEMAGQIITKPNSVWSISNKRLVTPTEYSFCVAMALQMAILFLFQCFWNYLSNLAAKENIMSSREFKFYIVWSATSIVSLPIIQIILSRNVYGPVYRESVPALIFGIQITIISLIGIITHYRFSKLFKKSHSLPNAHLVADNIEYYQGLNILLSLSLFIIGISTTVVAGDHLTAEKRVGSNKLSVDFFICNANICAGIVWFIVMLLLHPRPVRTGATQSTQEYANGYSWKEKEQSYYEKTLSPSTRDDRSVTIHIDQGSAVSVFKSNRATFAEKSGTVTSSVLSSTTLVSHTNQISHHEPRPKEEYDHFESIVVDEQVRDANTPLAAATNHSKQNPEIQYQPTPNNDITQGIPTHSSHPTIPRRSSSEIGNSRTDPSPALQYRPDSPELSAVTTKSQLPLPPQTCPATESITPSRSAENTELDYSGQPRRQRKGNSTWLRQSPRSPTTRIN